MTRSLVCTIDRWLQHRLGIVDFDDADGLIRIAVAQADRAIVLSDGTRIAAGETILELHLWNQNLPPIPPNGPNFAWVNLIRRQTDRSLRHLAAHVLAEPRYAAIQELRAHVAFANRRRAPQLKRVAAHYGFERVECMWPRGLGSRIHRRLDDLWLWLLVWTFNPQGLRGRRFRRHRHELWMSRSRLLEQYGRDRAPPPSRPS